jgi:chromosome segregation ATPase
MRFVKLGSALALIVLLLVPTAVGCGESDEEKAQNDVCDARADLKNRIDDLASLTITTATLDAVQEDLNGIRDDLNKIADAQGDLGEERRQEVESATQAFTAELKTVASNLGTNLSISDAAAKVKTAAEQLVASYKQTFETVDCG